MKKLEKQLELEFIKDYERSIRREEMKRLWKKVFKPSLIAWSVLAPIYLGVDYLCNHPEYIQATKELIKSIF